MSNVESFIGTRAQKAFLATIVTQAIVVLVMISLTFRFVAEHVDLNLPNYKTLPCYLALFIFAELFELVMGFDALRARNVIQLAGILLFHAALLVMAAIQVHETKTALVTRSGCDGSVDYVRCGGPHSLWHKVRPFLIVTPCIIGASWVVMIWFVRTLYAEFGWAIFRVVGANPAMKTMYQFYQIMICLLKFDFFCFTGVTMQLLIVVLSTNSAEFGLTIAAIPVVLVLLFGAAYAVQREIKSLMTIALILMLAAETYFYKLVRFYEPDSEGQYITTRATLTTFTIVAFLLLLTTFVIGLRCFSDFDKGLYKSKTYGQSLPAYSPLFRRKGRANAYSGEDKEDGGVLEPRLSIE